MGKILFIPFSIIAGLLAGLVAKKLFDVAWGLIDDEEPPESEHRDVSMARMTAAAAIQGAAFRGTRALADHASRRAYARVTGTWPGEEEPDPT